jgi:hypothetical protein
MVTGTTFEVVTLLAVLAVVRAVVSTFIAYQLVRNEQALVLQPVLIGLGMPLPVTAARALLMPPSPE